MFTQFFGNYLLRRQLVSSEQLSEALQIQKNTRLKLGVLAINAGLMTADQVEKAHDRQQRADKRIGDVMVEMGFLTKDQVEELLRTQPTGHLLLGQTLVDKGYMSNAQFESALKSYKEENSLSDSDMNNTDENAAKKLVAGFYNISSGGDSDHAVNYVSLIFKNLIRFIGDDFTPMEPFALKEPIKNVVLQNISGSTNMTTLIYAEKPALIAFASRFAKEEMSGDDEYTQACVSEFINLHNGLFAVNVSNDTGKELQLEPQCYYDEMDIKGLSKACVVPVNYPFGVINFVIAM